MGDPFPWIALVFSNALWLSLASYTLLVLFHVRGRLDKADEAHACCLRELEAVSAKLNVIEARWMLEDRERE